MRRRLAPYRLPLTGLVFLAILASLLVAAIVDYQGGFTRRTDAVLYVPDAGSQLAPGAQIKLHGAVVGTVRTIEPSTRGAKLTLALDPARTHLIPADTVARILPKTLVGQDYVDLVVPSGSTRSPITAGAVIRRDTSADAATLEGALDRLLDVLQALPPQQVASTLTSISTALAGRGEQLGTTLTSLQDYLSRLNPSIPTLTADLRALSRFSDTYDQAAPDLLAALRDLSTTSRTVTEQRAQVDSLFTGLRRTGDDLRTFLAQNQQNLIQLVDVSRPTLETLARYAPEYPCLLGQLAGLVPRIDRIFGKGEERPALNITLRVTNSRGKYLPNQDEPAYRDDRGPRCYQITRFAPQYPADGPIQDGSYAPPPARTETDSGAAPDLPARSERTGAAARGSDSRQRAASKGSDGAWPAALPGSDAEQSLIAGLLGLRRGESPFASLLMGPLLRGSEVSAR